jgi:hypothetical protein
MANYKTIFLNGIDLVYKTLLSIERPVILVFGHGAYDPANDALGPGAQSPPMNAFIYHEEEREGTDTTADRSTILFRNKDIVAAGISGRVEQSAKAIVDGRQIEVEFVGYDPVAGTVKFQTRK